ncbi:MAG: tRNA epoxyqueuosine(34) reductase QueG [Acidobacteria bacterium]|nr:tRNA epoxyqueuosine(34) reductase QueG [Acidobacteriota bacterium]
MRQQIVHAALEAGFQLAGIADVPEHGDAASQLFHQRYTQWIAEGRAAEMGYLQRVNEQGELVRASLHTAMPWARSVIVCALNYSSDAPRSIDPAAPNTGWIARYAWSGKPSEEGGALLPTDYHDTMLERLRRVEQEVLRLAGDSIQTKCYVDTGPIVERHFAQLSGIGWIGKNACVLNQEQGSWFLLGVIVTSMPVAGAVATLPAVDRCGSCTRCLDACPTGALTAPHQMDARLCISYLTIEKKGTIPEELRAQMGRQIFGCDICQDVCPWNRRPPVSAGEVMQPRYELVNPSLDWIAAMDNRVFRQHFRGSPLERTGRKRLHRNTAIAMGNTGDSVHLPRLQEWAGGEDAVLAEAAEWAIKRINDLQQSSRAGSASIEP